MIELSYSKSSRCAVVALCKIKMASSVGLKFGAKNSPSAGLFAEGLFCQSLRHDDTSVIGLNYLKSIRCAVVALCKIKMASSVGLKFGAKNSPSAGLFAEGLFHQSLMCANLAFLYLSC